jgi:hypothetical protein
MCHTIVPDIDPVIRVVQSPNMVEPAIRFVHPLEVHTNLTLISCAKHSPLCQATPTQPGNAVLGSRLIR